MTIKLVVLDIDGVLTDGRLYLDGSSVERKSLCFRDLDAVAQAQSKGLSLALLTGEDGPLCQTIADRLNITTMMTACKDKSRGIHRLAEQTRVPAKEIAFVGDSDRDAMAFAKVGLSFAPSDASPLARQLATFVLHAKGGTGAVAEALSIVAKLKASL